VKYWIGAAIAVLVAVVVVGLAVSISSSGSSRPTPFVLEPTPSPTASPTVRVTFSPIPSASPTPTAPPTCGDGSGDWNTCTKSLLAPLFQDYLVRFPNATYFPEGRQLGVFIEERVQWPDSCLGVSSPNGLCAEAITPGFRFVIEQGPGRPYAEYHTNLAGFWVFVTAYDTYQDVPP
jgi:hypothetical protein